MGGTWHQYQCPMPTTYLVLFLFCLLSALPSESPKPSPLTTYAADWFKHVSKSASPELESERLRLAVAGAAEERRRGGGRVASHILVDIHNISRRVKVYDRIEYCWGRIPGVVECCKVNWCGDMERCDGRYWRAERRVEASREACRPRKSRPPQSTSGFKSTTL